jgi:hypothetical protein
VASPEPKDYRRGSVVPEVVVDKLDLPLRRLDASDVRHEEVVATKWGRFSFFWDLEGNPLQFYESAFVWPDADPEQVPG